MTAQKSDIPTLEQIDSAKELSAKLGKELDAGILASSMKIRMWIKANKGKLAD